MLPLVNYNLCEIVHRIGAKRVLDIGCNQGNWADEIRHCVSQDQIVCVDGNSAHAHSVESKGYKFILGCLSDKVQKVKFYSCPADPFSSGRSVYLENTSHFSANCWEEVTTVTLDGLFPSETFDLIKMDIQGSEYDALCGGVKLMHRAKALILETATGLYEYNIGSPEQKVLIDYLDNQGFSVVGSICNLPYNNVIGHQDILFVANEYKHVFD